MHFVTTELQAHYRVIRPFRLPYHAGSMIRGILGRALRRTGCINQNDTCTTQCESPQHCDYARLFEPLVPNPPPHKFLRGQSRAPQPLIPIFHAPGRIDLHNNDEFSIVLRLLGPLRKHDATMMTETLANMAAFPFANEQGSIEFLEANILGAPETPISMAPPASRIDQLDIHFVTPTQIEIDKQLMVHLEFSPFFRNVYRRITELCALYGEGVDELDADFSRLDALAKNIVVTDRHITAVSFERQSLARNRTHPMRGLLGRVSFKGPNLGLFVPIFRIAEKTHIGKATSFGFGRIVINEQLLTA